MEIGERIQELRKTKQLSRRELSEKSGVSETAIKQYETGKRSPKVEQLQKIATALDTDVTFLLNGATASELAKETGRSTKEVEECAICDYKDSEEYRFITQGEKSADRAYLEATKSLTEQQLEQLLMDEYKKLNRLGRLKARECLAALTENPRFHAKDGDTNAT